MTPQVQYNETQHAWRNRFILTIMSCESITLTAILGAFAAKSTGQDRTALLIAWVVCVIVVPGLILSFRMRTRIADGTLRVWFPPFPAWRIDPSSIRHAMNVHGEQFIILTLDNDKKRTIGTQRPEELLTAIRVLAELPPDESEFEEGS